jgi:hypothetical protein
MKKTFSISLMKVQTHNFEKHQNVPQKKHFFAQDNLFIVCFTWKYIIVLYCMVSLNNCIMLIQASYEKISRLVQQRKVVVVSIFCCFFCLKLLNIVMSITISLVYRMYRRCKHLNCLKDLKVFKNLSSSFRFIFLFPKTICCYNSLFFKEWLSSYNHHLICMDFLGLACFSKVANLFCCVWSLNYKSSLALVCGL